MYQPWMSSRVRPSMRTRLLVLMGYTWKLETSNTEHEEKEEVILQIVNASASTVAHNTLE